MTDNTPRAIMARVDARVKRSEEKRDEAVDKYAELAGKYAALVEDYATLLARWRDAQASLRAPERTAHGDEDGGA